MNAQSTVRPAHLAPDASPDALSLTYLPKTNLPLTLREPIDLATGRLVQAIFYYPSHRYPSPLFALVLEALRSTQWYIARRNRIHIVAHNARLWSLTENKTKCST